MATRPLTGRVVVVPVGAQAAARAGAMAQRLAAEGATVVLVAGAGEGTEAGGLAGAIESSGTGRPAVFTLTPADDEADLDGLVEFLAEVCRLAG